MARTLSLCAIIGFVLTAATVAAMVLYSLDLARHGAEAANFATGQVVAIRNKTQTVYVTQPQIARLYALLALNAVLTIASTTLMLLGKRAG